MSLVSPSIESFGFLKNSGIAFIQRLVAASYTSLFTVDSLSCVIIDYSLKTVGGLAYPYLDITIDGGTSELVIQTSISMIKTVKM